MPFALFAADPAPRVALTFDDGPHPAGTRRLCAVLDQFGAKATFFVVGKVAAIYPDLVREMAAHGHEIGGHSWTHADFATLPPERLAWEIGRTRAFLEATLGVPAPLYRTPGGTQKSRLKLPPDLARNEVRWTLHTLDHQGAPADVIAQRLLNARDGDIILMHNGLRTTTAALECALPELRARGYTFVTVSELMRHPRAGNAVADAKGSK
jgi:peptidoglycan/xylan/chitin deacetylase (PgdA/CDA1 family)